MKVYSFNAKTPFEFEIKDLSDITQTKRKISGVPHRTNFYQIIRIETGKSVQTVDFNPVEVVGGQILFIAKNQVVSFDVSTGYKGQIILFTDLFFNRCECDTRFMKQLNLFNSFTGNTSITINETMATCWQLIRDEFYLENDHFQSNHHCLNFQSNLIHSYLSAFLIHAERQSGKNALQAKNPEYKIAMLFAELVELNFKSLRKVNDYLSLIGVSDKNLSSALQTVTGKTPKQFIDDHILLEAKRLLVYSNESIKEITFLLGFDEPSNFTKYFYKNTQMTPAQFRSTIKY